MKMNSDKKGLKNKKAFGIASIVSGLATYILGTTLGDYAIAWIPMACIFLFNICFFIYFSNKYKEAANIKRREKRTFKLKNIKKKQKQKLYQEGKLGKEAEDPNFIAVFNKAVIFNFPELPKPEFILKTDLFNQLEKECEEGKPTITTLQSILIEMEHHVGISSSNQSIIMFTKIDDNKAGYIEKMNYSLNEITIAYNDIFKANNYISILAHELSHAYQFSKNKHTLFTGTCNLNEKFTDALTFYLGFGEYTKKGKRAVKVTTAMVGPNVYKKETRSSVLGYLNEGYFYFVEKNSNKLFSERKKQKAEKDENNKMITKIEASLKAYKTYLESSFLIIDDLKNKQLSSSEFELISGFYIKYNESSYSVLESKIKNYKTQNLSANKENLKIIETEMTDLFEIYNKIKNL